MEVAVFPQDNPPETLTFENVTANINSVTGFTIFQTSFPNLLNCTNYNLTAYVYSANRSIFERTSSVVATACGCGGGNGDPHYHTLDGRKFNFNGNCTYVLLKDCENNPPHFEIQAKHGMLVNNKARRIVGVQIITTNPRLHAVALHEHSRVTLDGNTYKDGTFTLPNLSLENTNIPNTKLLYLNDHGLWVTYGEHTVEVGVVEDTESLRGQLCGMLGNSNGDPDDDFVMPDGSRTDDATEFGNSWKVPNSC
ncbi:BMP-binding endothelial regulator protein-like [Glandiceps talaboti]